MSIDKNRTEGSAKNAKGKAKETFGKVTGDQKTQADRKADQAKGKAENTVGSAKDKAEGKPECAKVCVRHPALRYATAA